MVTLHPAFVLALEHVQFCRDVVQGAEPTGKYLHFFLSPPIPIILSCPYSKATLFKIIPLTQRYNR